MNEFIIQVGTKGCGKTKFCKEYLTINPRLSGLILDVDDEYTEYKKLEIDKLLQDYEGICRLNFKDKSIEEASNLYANTVADFIANNLKEATLICENPQKLTLTDTVFGLLTMGKSKHLNTLLNLNSLRPLFSTELLTKADYLYLYNTVDKVERYKRFKTIDSKYYDLLLEAEKLLDVQSRVIIDLRKMCID